jgi:hypothetical protein
MEFFRSLFSRAVTAPKSTPALAAEVRCRQVEDFFRSLFNRAVKAA